jgi:hypothetical protein
MIIIFNMIITASKRFCLFLYDIGINVNTTNRNYAVTLPCDLLLRAPVDKDHPTTHYVADLVEGLHGICHYFLVDAKVTSDRTKAR